MDVEDWYDLVINVILSGPIPTENLIVVDSISSEPITPNRQYSEYYNGYGDYGPSYLESISLETIRKPSQVDWAKEGF